MSTFDGFIKEFPTIQVDYFRNTAATARCRPLAYFLSHVHSDHLVGLDAVRSPFVYCSATTRALVLQLESYPCRINLAKGILEARKRTYKDRKQLLKPLPLETPTVIELSPGNSIQVTLFDANHCPGSVMFLFENEHNAALYTGDTRLEPWFVNALVHSPCLATYTSGLRTIDTVYMDTTFLDTRVEFQTKAEGLRELLQAVARYPDDTVFYFRAWTFGYEEVWIALAKALKSKVHVDSYKMSLYKALIVKEQGRRFGSQFHLDRVAPGLVGFMCANASHDGCLDLDGEAARLHSCEKDTDYCATVRGSPVVWISPVVCRSSPGRQEMLEVGAGGGGKDLNKEAELEVSSKEEIAQLCQLYVGKNESVSAEAKAELQYMLAATLQNNRHIPVHIDLDIDSHNDDRHAQMGVRKIEDVFREMITKRDGETTNATKHEERDGEQGKGREQPRTITFPYSRHSSYREQCDLLDKLRPKDVWPCTVNTDAWFCNGSIVTIRDLFGRFCSGDVFRHDVEVAAKYLDRDDAIGLEILDSQATTDSAINYCSDTSLPELNLEPAPEEELPIPKTVDCRPLHHPSDYPYFYHGSSLSSIAYADVTDLGGGEGSAREPEVAADAELFREKRVVSYLAVVHNAIGKGDWVHIGLTSTTDNHTLADTDLGYG